MPRARFLGIFAVVTAMVAIAAFLLIAGGQTGSPGLLGSGVVAGLAAAFGLVVLGRVVFVQERQRIRR